MSSPLPGRLANQLGVSAALGVRRDTAARAGNPRGGRPRSYGRRRTRPRQCPGSRLIVLIRTVLSFSLETEIEGVVPRKRAQMSGVGGIRQASASALKSNPHP